MKQYQILEKLLKVYLYNGNSKGSRNEWEGNTNNNCSREGIQILQITKFKLKSNQDIMILWSRETGKNLDL